MTPKEVEYIIRKYCDYYKTHVKIWDKNFDKMCNEISEKCNIHNVSNNEVAVIEKTCHRHFDKTLYGDYCKERTCNGCLFFR